jgi:hypothetical protein
MFDSMADRQHLAVWVLLVIFGAVFLVAGWIQLLT